MLNALGIPFILLSFLYFLYCCFLRDPTEYKLPSRLHLCRGIRLTNKCPGYDPKPSQPSRLALENTPTDSLQRRKNPQRASWIYDTKQCHGEVPVMPELWRMQSTPSLPLLPGPLKPGLVAPSWVRSMGQIELNYVLVLNWTVWNGTVHDIETVLTLNWIVRNRTVFTFSCVNKNYTYTKLNCM